MRYSASVAIQFRYTIVESTNNETANERIIETMRLCAKDLWLGIRSTKFVNIATKLDHSNGRNITAFDAVCTAFYRDWNRSIAEPPVLLTLEDLQELATIDELRSNLKVTDYPMIDDAIRNFLVGDSLPLLKFRDLNSYAVLESLLSHAPAPTDTYDSIRKQLVRNIILLNNRASKIHHIEYDTKKLNKVISELYSYRSCLLYTSPSPRDQRGSRMPSSA